MSLSFIIKLIINIGAGKRFENDFVTISIKGLMKRFILEVKLLFLCPIEVFPKRKTGGFCFFQNQPEIF
jgi:hypothetical protein